MSSDDPVRVTITRSEVLLGLMAFLSLALLFVPQEWFSRRIVVEPEARPKQLFNDKWNGGNSVVSWVNQESTHWRCELGKGFPQAYCSMQLALSDENGKGLDLTGIEKLTIGLVYKGEDSHVRIYLRNRHPAYYEPGNDTTTKYNVVQVPVKDLKDGLVIKLADFSVADWWLVQKQIPLEYSRPEFGDLAYLEIQTGTSTFSGMHEFRLEKITFEGLRLSDRVFYRGIIALWSVILFTILFKRLIRLNNALKENRHYRQDIKSINELLELPADQVEDLPETDSLTGVLSRRGIRAPLYDGMKKRTTQQRSFSMIMIRIDYFTKIVDNYGGEAMDEILKASANLLRQNVRHSDYVARWDVETFLLLCPDTTAEQARHVAETMRNRIELQKNHRQIPLTASFGVASLEDADLPRLFNSASQALTEAQDNGGNRVVCTTVAE